VIAFVIRRIFNDAFKKPVQLSRASVRAQGRLYPVRPAPRGSGNGRGHTDHDGAVETLRSRAPNMSKAAKVLCGGAYGGENLANAVRPLIPVDGEVAKRNEPHRFAVLPKRRV
jgi:hypothetical protein